MYVDREREGQTASMCLQPLSHSPDQLHFDMTYIKEFLLDGKKVVLIYQQTCKCMSFNVSSQIIVNR